MNFKGNFEFNITSKIVVTILMIVAAAYGVDITLLK
ncbi:MAG: hypothetical protein K0Q73_5370 [Paenibacillus sp.]|jgi:hypothetical protein|nr:hypothetical protein [Paenibacillus sp.]